MSGAIKNWKYKGNNVHKTDVFLCTKSYLTEIYTTVLFVRFLNIFIMLFNASNKHSQCLCYNFNN